MSSTTECLVFEGVNVHDANYSLLYAAGFLVLVYPTQMICIYQDNSYFSRRVEDPHCRGLDFFYGNLLGGVGQSVGATRGLILKHVL